MHNPLTKYNLTERQAVYLLAILQNPNLHAAAQQLGVSHATLYRTMNKPDFRKALHHARAQMFTDAMGVLQTSATDAVAVLKSVMADPEASNRDRIAAAKAIIEYGLNSYEVFTLTDRVNELEQLAGGQHD